MNTYAINETKKLGGTIIAIRKLVEQYRKIEYCYHNIKKKLQLFSNPISQLKEEEGGEDDIKHKYSIFNIEEQNRKIFCSTAIDMAMIEGRDMSKFIQVNKVCKNNFGVPKIFVPESFNMTILHQLFD